ncbi:MAG: acyclic terpene utilization AtuA family protein [Alphaproteobacteria bacterium]|nr:acyclic terpene utilization AtuA family protein [Alphaproteobacteria bacterium]
MSESLSMMATTGLLGYGFGEDSFRHGLAMDLDFIAADAGSMDPGPHYLGAGIPFVSRKAIKRDLGLMLEGALEKGIPMLIGSAGGGGSAPQVALVREIIEEIAAERGYHFKMAVIHADQGKDYLHAKLKAGKIEPLGPIDDVTPETIEETHRVVAMMGVEPFQKALRDGAQVVLAGRATDASIYSAIPLMRGYDPGLVWHLSKIIECAGAVAVPKTGQDCMIGTLKADHFLVAPAHPDSRCTRMSVAAHTLYENPSPYHLEEPGGTLVTLGSTYEQLDHRTVKVAGSRFEKANRYTVKLEGVRRTGFRTIFVAGARDPGLIAIIDDFIDSCRARVRRAVAVLDIRADQYKLNIHIYGKSGTMGSREPIKNATPHEIGILAEVLADDEETSMTVMAKTRLALLHSDFPGRQCISGNLAIPFSPSDIPVGETYEFSLWHIMEIDDPLEPFPIEMVEL